MKKFITIAAMAAFAVLGTVNASAADLNATVLAELGFTPAQIAVVMDLLGSTTTSDSMLSAHDGVNLQVGVTSTRVGELQTCMNAAGFPTGKVDNEFGPNTAIGVMAFQVSTGVKPDGVVGVLSTPAFQAACPINVVVVDEPVEEVPESEFTLGGEGDITDFEIKSEDDADSASDDQNVATIEFEVEDGDVVLEKVELFFEEDTVTNDLWENIKSIQLVVDGEEIADVDVSNDDDWREHDDSANTGKDVYSISLKGDTVFQDGDKVEVEVMIETTDEVETGDNDEDYNMWAELRFVNGEDVSIYEGNDEDNDTDAKAFSVVSLGSFDLDITESNDSPEDNDSIDLSGDEEEVLVIVDVEVEEDQDGTLEDAEVDVAVAISAGVNETTSAITVDTDELINELRFMVDGNEVDADDASETITIAGGSCSGASLNKTDCVAAGDTWTDSVAPAAKTVTFKFDLDDMEVEAEDKFEVTIEADLKELDDDSEFIGATVQSTVIRIDGENQEGDSFTQETESTISYSPVFTATAGLIDVDFTDEPVAFEGSTENAGTIVFTVRIENNTGSDLTGMNTVGNWDLDVDGFGGVTVSTVTDENQAVQAGEDTLSDSDDAEYEVTLAYTSVSSATFSVEIEEIGAEDVPVAVTWED